MQAALASFVTFALGAFIPLLPWLITCGTAAIVGSIVLGAVASIAVGVVLAAYTERSYVRSALRQLVSHGGGFRRHLWGGQGDRDRDRDRLIGLIGTTISRRIGGTTGQCDRR